ncbi:MULTISPECIES: antitoxin Xre/MbcA/ParS toxin-binding domain-containing protein [Burkholderia]|uniref:antitoxin Xre/MbcA/ParS toxin-binding domain-containing protein n=1 Tax=Burkholderia TaxID=32008 RepID=UPI0009BD0234
MLITRSGDSRDSQPLGSYPSGISHAVIEMLATQVQNMVEVSGNPDGFDVQSWLFDWLHSPVPALGGQRPVDCLHTPEGIDLISRLLASAQTGAYW